MNVKPKKHFGQHFLKDQSICEKIAKSIVLKEDKVFPLMNSYSGYLALANSGEEQPQATNANRYHFNNAYESTAYNKGAVFLSQLGYIIGTDNLFKALQAYYNEYKFKHPVPNDMRRIAERVSGIQLRWYLTDWTQTVNKIDYAIEDVVPVKSGTQINLKRIGLMPMPLDILVRYKDGSQEFYYVPITLMRGEKENPYDAPWHVEKDWSWSNPNYTLSIDRKTEEIDMIIIGFWVHSLSIGDLTCHTCKTFQKIENLIQQSRMNADLNINNMHGVLNYWLV